jgi:putative Holliday junction resolvase
MSITHTYMGLDRGTTRIGVSIADSETKLALPLLTLDAKPRSKFRADLRALIQERGVRTLVVGWPLSMDGSQGRATRNVDTLLEYLDSILEEFGVDVVRWDERLTTTSAESLLIDADMSRRRRKKVIDQVAATHILESYLGSV